MPEGITPKTESLFTGDSVGVKVCGITTGEQAQQIVALGADAIGVNYWPKSKRYIEPARACEWLSSLDSKVIRVAVFVNPTDDELRSVFDSGCIDFLQLHGDERSDRVNSLIQEGLPVFKALGVKDRTMLDGATDFEGKTLLLDAYAPVEYGGSGETMDWSLGAEAVRQWPDREIILAGGLKPDNIADAIRQVNPAGVDVASGVESFPGMKDLDLVKAFIKNARKA